MAVIVKILTFIVGTIVLCSCGLTSNISETSPSSGSFTLSTPTSVVTTTEAPAVTVPPTTTTTEPPTPTITLPVEAPVVSDFPALDVITLNAPPVASQSPADLDTLSTGNPADNRDVLGPTSDPFPFSE